MSAAALWQQRRRWRQKHKLVSISIDLAPDAIDNLIRLGWLGSAERGDKLMPSPSPLSASPAGRSARVSGPDMRELGSMLTPKQARFVEEYLVDLNAKQAAIRARYSPKTAEVQGCRLLRNVQVAAAIQRAQAERSKRTAVTADMVVAELAKLGFANILDYMRLADGERVVDLSAATRDQLAAVKELVVEDFFDGRGEDAREVRRVKIKLADKIAALDKLGRHLGIYNDTLEVKGALTLEQLVNASFRPDRGKL